MSIVTVAEAKAHSNIEHDADDELIAAKIDAAELYVGAFVGKRLADFTPLPADLKEAVLQLVASWYENREAVLVGVSAEYVPLSVHDLMAQHREWSF